MRPIGIKNHPFRFLLYLEWALLAVATLTELLPVPLPRFIRFPLLTVAGLITFGVMGLRLPTGSLPSKWLFTGLEFWLIWLAGNLGAKGIRLFPFLYLILVIRSCLIFKLPGRLAVTVLAFFSFLVTLINRVETTNFPGRPLIQEKFRAFIFNLTINSALLFGLILVFVLLLVNALLAERESQEKLAVTNTQLADTNAQLEQANQQLRRYANRIEDQATLQERNRIAREIHDSLGHFLTALNIQLEGGLKLWKTDPEKAYRFLAEAKRLGSTALQEVRQSVAALRSDPLQGRSLEAAIASLAQTFQQNTGIQLQTQITLPRPVPTELNATLYRIVQEALTNIYKHATATQVTIQLTTNATDLHIQIQDNGRGFQQEQNTTGFGLQGMRERTMVQEGRFQVISEPGAGCCIQACFPLPTPLSS